MPDRTVGVAARFPDGAASAGVRFAVVGRWRVLALDRLVPEQRPGFGFSMSQRWLA